MGFSHDSVILVDLTFLAFPDGSVTSFSLSSLFITAMPVGRGGLSVSATSMYSRGRDSSLSSAPSDLTTIL